MTYHQSVPTRGHQGILFLFLIVLSFVTKSDLTSATEASESSEEGTGQDYVDEPHDEAIPYVIGGSFAGSGQFPHQVSLYRPQANISFCGGSILSPNLILTAAHCVKSKWPSSFVIIAGVTNLNLEEEENKQIMDARSIYIHEDYDERIFANDIAIISLDSDLQYSRAVSYINLPKENETFEEYTTVTGWGITEHNKKNSFSDKLKMANLTIVGDKKCRRYYKSYNLTENQLCAGGKMSNSCLGDSGGPAISRIVNTSTWALRGIVSFGRDGCGKKGAPSVLTRVARYVDWIKFVENEISEDQYALQKLMRNGVNAKNGNLETPLHRAAVSSDKKFAINVILYLLENGADVNAMDKEGYTFLHRLVDNWSDITTNQFHDIVVYLVAGNLSNLFNIADNRQGTTPLMLSAANVDLSAPTLSLLHENNVNFTLLDKLGKSALFYATEGSHSQELLAGILNLKTVKLSEAIDLMDENLVKHLVQLGVDVNEMRGNLGIPINHAAALKNKTFTIKTIKYLINYGAKINVTDGEGETFLHKLMSNGSTLNSSEILDIAQYLHSKRSAELFNVQDNNRGATPLMLAARNAEMDRATLVFLGRIGANLTLVDNNGRSYKAYATEGGKNPELATTDANLKHKTLAEAIKDDDMDSVKAYIWLGADANEKNNKSRTLLHLAAESNNKVFAINTLKLLIGSGANVFANDRHNRTFLHVLLRHGTKLKPGQFRDIVAYLVSKDQSFYQLFNVRMRNEVTPFQLAVHSVEVERETLTLLQNNSVDFNAVDSLGSSVLCYATFANRTLKLVSDLVDLGANPKHLNKYEMNMLHRAAKNGNVGLLKFFLGEGLDVNARDYFGQTALHYAVMSHENVFNVVQFLLRNGANIDIVNDNGDSPRDLFLRNQDFYPDKEKISTCFALGSSC